MIRLTVVIICLLIRISNTQNNNYFQKAEHIPLAVINWGGYLSYDYKMIDSMGADALVVSDLTPALYDHIKNGAPNLKLIPYTTGTLTNDLICQYSEGMYNEWGVVDDSIEGKYQFGNDLSKIEISGDTVKTKTNAGMGEIIYGPGEWFTPQFTRKSFFRGYPQQSKFLLGDPGYRTIEYNCDFKLKIGRDPYYQQDTLVPVEDNKTVVCTLRVGYRGEGGGDFIPVEEKTLLMENFREYDEWSDFSFDSSYTWINTQTTEKEVFIGNTEATRDYQLRTEIQIKFSGYQYVNLYVCKIVNYDLDRGKSLMTTTNFNNNIKYITENIKPDSSGYIYTNGSYDSTVISWYAVDEPGSFDNFAVIKKIDSLMNAASNGKRRLYITHAGIFNGAVGNNIKVHKALLERTGGAFYPTLQNYIMESPYQSLNQGITSPPYRSLDTCNWANIAHFIVNIEQFAKYDSINGYTKPFGLMLQTGKWDSILLRSPTIPQFLYMANMGLMYGAKLLALNNYFHSDENPDLTSLYNLSTSVYSGLWKTTRDTLSPRLKGLLGKTLKNLYQSGQITGIDAKNSGSYTVNSGKVLYIKTQDNSTAKCSLDVGFFTGTTPNDAKDYFYLVNRHYSEINNIEIGFKSLNNYNNWTLKNYVDSSATTIVKDANNRGIHNDTILPGDGMLYSLAPTVKYGGEIDSNETLTSETLTENDLTINSGKTLTVVGTYNCYKNIMVNSGGKLDLRPGSTLNFYNGAKLIVNGSLIAKGKNYNDSLITIDFQSPDATSLNSVQLNPGSIDTISYCLIQNGYYGIKADSVEAHISDNEITDCVDGIYVTDSGYMVNESEGMRIDNNNIHKNAENGISLSNSFPLIQGNIITRNSTGIYCEDNSGPLLCNLYDVGLNNILENDNGLYSYDSSPLLGSEASEFYGYNAVVGYKGAENEVFAMGGSYIIGENCWWGEYPPEKSHFYKDSTSSFDYDPALDYNPVGGSSKVKQEEDVTIDPESNIQRTEGNPGLTTKDKYASAIKKFVTGDKITAAGLLREIISEEPDSAVSLASIRLLMRIAENETEKDSLTRYLSATANSNENKEIAVYSRLRMAEISGGDYISTLNMLLSSYPGTNYKLYIKYKKFGYYLNEKGDKENAGRILSEMTMEYPEHRLTREARKRMGTIITMTKGNSEKTKGEELTYKLENNYPNPFNPETVIRYQIPVNSKVTLGIYDILGREVARLVDKEQEAGKHEVRFNGSRFSSGVYIYRIITPDYTLSKKLILVK